MDKTNYLIEMLVANSILLLLVDVMSNLHKYTFFTLANLFIMNTLNTIILN